VREHENARAIVAVIVSVDMHDPVIVAVHVHGNDTVGVIGPP
jgi:hypothetical protein